MTGGLEALGRRQPSKASKASSASFSSSASSASSPLVTTALEMEGQVAVITLNNPSKLNALTEPMGDALISSVEELKDLKDLRVAILTGSGKAFSAGGDLDWLLARHRDTVESNIRVMQAFYKKFLILRTL